MYENTGSYKSVFAFGMLKGPLLDFGCAEIDGVTGGFGYNSLLTLPQGPADVLQFPLLAINSGIQAASSNLSGQMTALSSGGGCVSPMADSMWLCAGLDVRAFEMVDLQAVVALDITSNPVFSLLGEASAVVPKGVDSSSAIVVIDIGIKAVIDPAHGVMSMQGVLLPTSHVLDPACQLTGGFITAYFFNGSGHEGDWVVSIGGFHPLFKPPPWYPPAPPRLGITWAFDSEINITGAAYFAITLSACMAGASLALIYQSGRLSAGFTASADFLMYFRPLYMIADASVDIYCSAVIGPSWWPLAVHANLSAAVHLHGPPLGGSADVSLWFISFTVYFGDDTNEGPVLGLKDFLASLKQSDDPSSVLDLIFTVAKGLIPASSRTSAKADTKGQKGPAGVVTTSDKKSSNDKNSDADGGQPFTPQTFSSVVLVRSHDLSFTIQTRFPYMTASVAGQNIALESIVPNPASITVFAQPMRLQTPFDTSHIKISVTKTLGKDDPPSFTVTPAATSCAAAVWAKSESNDSSNPPSIDSMNQGNIMLPMSLTLTLNATPLSDTTQKPVILPMRTFSIVELTGNPLPVPDPPAAILLPTSGNNSKSKTPTPAESQDMDAIQTKVSSILESKTVQTAQSAMRSTWNQFRQSIGASPISTATSPSNNTTILEKAIKSRYKLAGPFFV